METKQTQVENHQPAPCIDLFEIVFQLHRLWVELPATVTAQHSWHAKRRGVPPPTLTERVIASWSMVGVASLAHESRQGLPRNGPVEMACLSPAGLARGEPRYKRRRVTQKTHCSVVAAGEPSECIICFKMRGSTSKFFCGHGWFCLACLELHAGALLENGVVSLLDDRANAHHVIL